METGTRVLYSLDEGINLLASWFSSLERTRYVLFDDAVAMEAHGSRERLSNLIV